MNRTVCRRTFRVGAMRGAAAVAVRFGEKQDDRVLNAKVQALMQKSAVACGEVWIAADRLDFPVSEEEHLRGRDRKIEACLLIETLRVPDAEEIANDLMSSFPRAAISAYRLLCEVRP